MQSFYKQYDDVVVLYNEKFGKPATALMKKIKEGGLITTDVEFDEKLEWTYYYLWHHEGRRARMGASMMGPDYTQWHGMFEVGDRFYMEFVPEVREVIAEGRMHGKAAAAAEVEKLLNEILSSDMHKWSLGKMSAEEKAARKQAQDEFKKRYVGN